MLRARLGHAPLGYGKVLELAPPLGADEFADALAKDMAATASDVRLVPLGVGDPGKDAVIEDLAPQGGYIGLGRGPNMDRQED